MPDRDLVPVLYEQPSNDSAALVSPRSQFARNRGGNPSSPKRRADPRGGVPGLGRGEHADRADRDGMVVGALGDRYERVVPLEPLVEDIRDVVTPLERVSGELDDRFTVTRQGGADECLGGHAFRIRHAGAPVAAGTDLGDPSDSPVRSSPLATIRAMATTPIVLVPGFWLGAWAWDEVAGLLRAGGHGVTALTLPGLESVDTDRSGVRLADHVDAICGAVMAVDRSVVLAVHSGAAVPGYAVTDRIPDRVAAMVYVDTAPAAGPLDPDLAAPEVPLPPLAELAKEENLDGLSAEQLETFETRAVPEPGGAIREGSVLVNDSRLDVPSTVVCTGFSSEQVKAAMAEGYAWLAGLAELRNVTYVDLPTSHWPMWSRPKDLAALIGDVARSDSSA